MIIGKTIYAIDSHTAGAPTRIIIGGVPDLPGKTMIEKAAYFKHNLDYIRTAIFYEPRGLISGEGALITSPTNSEARFGVFFMSSDSQLIPMCVHASMGVVTAAIEFGMVDAIEPLTTVVLDTVVGLVTGYAKVQDGTVESVSIRNVPSFLYQSTTIDVPSLGSIPVDVAYGGEFFAIIESSDIRPSLDIKNVSRLVGLAKTIRNAVNSQVRVKHPLNPISKIDGIRICNKPTKKGMHIRSVTIFEAGVDRCPCGAGASAHVAALYAKERIRLNQECIHESIIGTTFKSKPISQSKVDGFDAVIPEITGTAYTTGVTTFVLSPNDPLKNGFLIKK